MFENVIGTFLSAELNFRLMAYDGSNYTWGDASLQNCDYQSEKSVILTRISEKSCSLEKIISYDEMIPVIIQSLMFKVFVV